MHIKQLASCVACVALMSGCASTGTADAGAGKAASMTGALADADNALRLGQTDKAIGIFKTAASHYPTDKTPYVRMAQLRFDSANYGEAIINALAALERDPDDMLANSIVAVSGLRVASKALGDLTQKNNLSGSVRNEAQDLAKLLRNALGEEVLVPTAAKREAPRPVVKKAATAAAPGAAPAPALAAPAAKPATSGADPFGALK
jgi:tetratricopeptide (TPR) repeat protein